MGIELSSSSVSSAQAHLFMAGVKSSKATQRYSLEGMFHIFEFQGIIQCIAFIAINHLGVWARGGGW